MKINSDETAMIKFGCPEQGLADKSYTLPEFEEFVDQQIEEWKNNPLQATLSTSDGVTKELSKLYIQFWENLLPYNGIDTDFKIASLAADTRRYSLIIAKGSIWQTLKKVQSEQIYLTITDGESGFTEAPHPTERTIRALSASLFKSPMEGERSSDYSMAFVDQAMLQLIWNGFHSGERILVEQFSSTIKETASAVAELHKSADVNNSNAQESSVRFQEAIDLATKRFEDLEKAYKKELKFNQTVKYWRNRAFVSYAVGWISFAAFVALLYLAYSFLTSNWGWLEAQLDKMMLQSSGSINLTSIMAISVPVLAFGWLLRHVSRLFIQNLALADDAKYRQVMTMTFLGLQKDENAGITDTERALILNALFRPTPLNTAAEDGPPAGLLDLIKGKPGA